MLSATIGAQTAAAQYQAPESKPANSEAERPNIGLSAPEQTAETSAPAVPATNSTPISVEAVTALQQVEAEAAPETQAAPSAPTPVGTGEAPAATTTPVDIEITPPEATGVEAAAQQVEQLEEESVQSRATSDNTVAASEDTDGAGRSARNPIDLQI